MACEIEIKILKNPIGKQDQYAAAYGGVNHIAFLKNSRVKVSYKKRYIRFIKKLFQNSLLLYTGITRNASDILAAQKKQKKVFEKLIEINKICNNFLKIQNKDLTINVFQDFLNQSWRIKKDLTNKTSNHKIDKIYKLAKLNGAKSLKLLGAGGGGFFFVIIDKKRKNIFKKAMSKYKFMDLEYENEGSKVILKN